MSAQRAMNVRNKFLTYRLNCSMKRNRRWIGDNPEAEVRDQTRGMRRAYGNLLVRLGLYQFGRLTYFNDNGY
ncbi:MAG: hypothetical protein V3R78_06125 [Thermodesulfobacteriota bacterium]